MTKWIDLMLGSAEVAARPFLIEVQQNLDNCIGESGKTKHLIEARWQRLKSLSQLVILFLRAETF
jgi:precorrin-6B methylase 2